MPELPEVEVVRRKLEEVLINRTIVDVLIRYPNIIKTEDFKNKVINNKILKINRRGKYLIFELSNYYMVVHLRMEGKFFYVDNSNEFSKHEHLIFYLDNNKQLRYHDVRKFGIFELYDKDKLYLLYDKLGVEVFDDYIDYDLLLKKINKCKNKHLKTILLDQSIYLGLGNIYVDEVLFLSRINPLRLGSSLTMEELKEIVKHSKEVFNKSILNGGTTFRTFNSLGIKGNYQNYLNVHLKEVCPLCNKELEKIKINGRTTYYCKNCQR